MTSSTELIHIAKTALGLDEETYRAKLRAITGKSSTRDMCEQERRHVLDAFGATGFEHRKPPRKLSGRYAHKLQALWIAGWNLDVFCDRSDAALEAFVRRQTGLERERFLHQADDAAQVIEALKGWLAREAGVDWSDRKTIPAWQKRPGYRISWAQWAILHGDDKTGFWPAVTALAGEAPGYRGLSDRQWILVMNDLGRDVRASRKREAGA